MSEIVEQKWALESYAKWCNNKWEEKIFNKQSCYLIMKYSLLMVVHKVLALESLCLMGGGGRIEPFFANAFIGIKVTDKMGKTSKFRVKFLDGFNNKSSTDNCLEVVEKLKIFLPVTQHSSRTEKTPEEAVTKTMQEMVKDLLETESHQDFQAFLSEDLMDETIQLCLLDPGFPDLVDEFKDYYLSLGE